MSYAEMILPEFDQEMASTRRVLERVPDDKLSWKCHPKSNTIGWNANHLAEIPSWVAGTLVGTEWDFAPVGGQPYKSPDFQTTKEILDFFDTHVAEARGAIASASDESMNVIWTLLDGGKPVISMPRASVIRGFTLNHMIHHRAILTVYLRLNDIPVPGMYGPSGDE